MRGLSILGSTGSIGQRALEVVGQPPLAGELRVVGLAAGRNVERLAEQVRRHRPRVVSVSRPADRDRLAERLGEAATGVELLSGEEGARAVAACPEADVVLSAMVGAVGLEPTLSAIRRGVKTLAIANKEPLVIAGNLCMEEARRRGVQVVPVDSEHSAIFQLTGDRARREIRRLLLTGSGGPFRGARDLAGVTPEQALAHPTWSMGPKISVDSATLMNKGLEVIEARWLFDVPTDRIEVLIHPESVVHSMVELIDGSVLAHLGTPDMRIPIAHALAFPERPALALPRLDLCHLGKLSFEPPDTRTFPCLALAYRALDAGPTHPAVLNAANEVAVQAFLDHRLQLVEIPEVIERCLDRYRPPRDAALPDLLAADRWARQEARERVGR